MRLDEGTLELVDITPNPGWVATEIQASPTQVHIKFVRAEEEVEFEATIEDGAIHVEVRSA